MFGCLLPSIIVRKANWCRNEPRQYDFRILCSSLTWKISGISEALSFKRDRVAIIAKCCKMKLGYYKTYHLRIFFLQICLDYSVVPQATQRQASGKYVSHKNSESDRQVDVSRKKTPFMAVSKGWLWHVRGFQL